MENVNQSINRGSREEEGWNTQASYACTLMRLQNDISAANTIVTCCLLPHDAIETHTHTHIRRPTTRASGYQSYALVHSHHHIKMNHSTSHHNTGTTYHIHTAPPHPPTFTPHRTLTPYHYHIPTPHPALNSGDTGDLRQSIQVM